MTSKSFKVRARRELFPRVSYQELAPQTPVTAQKQKTKRRFANEKQIFPACTQHLTSTNPHGSLESNSMYTVPRLVAAQQVVGEIKNPYCKGTEVKEFLHLSLVEFAEREEVCRPIESVSSATN